MARRRPPPSRRTDTKYPAASSELTPQEVRVRFGDVIEAFLYALRTDPTYLAEFAHAVRAVAAVHDRRQEAQRQRYQRAEHDAQTG